MSIAKRMDDIPFSGIRKVFEKVGAMEAAGHEVIHMEIGRPDFGTPDPMPLLAHLFFLCTYGGGNSDPGSGGYCQWLAV
jgi:aminotransferase